MSSVTVTTDDPLAKYRWMPDRVSDPDPDAPTFTCWTCDYEGAERVFDQGATTREDGRLFSWFTCPNCGTSDWVEVAE